jgi:hypothetical protein
MIPPSVLRRVDGRDETPAPRDFVFPGSPASGLSRFRDLPAGCLEGRTIIAEREQDLFFPVPDRTVQSTVLLFDMGPARKRCSHRMTRPVHDKHGKRRYQVIEEAVSLGVGKRRLFHVFVRVETPIRIIRQNRRNVSGWAMGAANDINFPDRYRVMIW